MHYGPSEGEGGGLPKLIYISLFSNLSRQGEGGGHKFGKIIRRRLCMAPKQNHEFDSTSSQIAILISLTYVVKKNL